MSFRIGHATDLTGITGVSVVLCPPGGAVAGVDVRGGAPGTRETDLLRPDCMVERVHAVMLGGGSAFGLAAADGVMRWLEAHNIGFDVGVAKVPIVPAAILFDLPIGDPKVRPDAAMGFAACEAAAEVPPAQGSVGAGTGACVGKLTGLNSAVKGGIGYARVALAGEVWVDALVALNAFGDVFDPASNQIVAGARNPQTGTWLNTYETLKTITQQDFRRFAGRNTTLGVVMTNAALSKAECQKMAAMAQNGFARCIRPVHTMGDGDVIFALSGGDARGNVNVLGEAAAEACTRAILNALHAATSLGGVPALRDLSPETRR
jgi:L-aminopeptidase/D-esterase-like protein